MPAFRGPRLDGEVIQRVLVPHYGGAACRPGTGMIVRRLCKGAGHEGPLGRNKRNFIL